MTSSPSLISQRIAAISKASVQEVVNNTFWVGVYPGMTDEKIDYMAKTIINSVK